MTVSKNKSKKNTARLIVDGHKAISQIIRGSVSTQADLQQLATKLGLDVHFDWIDNYDPKNKLNLMNIDADHIGGSHWIAIYNDDHYFDPLGLPIARDGLDYLQYTTLPIQNWKHGACGLYAMLFLYYANMNEIDKFYNLFG